MTKTGGLNLVSAFSSLIKTQNVMEVHAVGSLTDNLASTCHFEHEDKWVHRAKGFVYHRTGWSFAFQLVSVPSLP